MSWRRTSYDGIFPDALQNPTATWEVIVLKQDKLILPEIIIMNTPLWIFLNLILLTFKLLNNTSIPRTTNAVGSQ